MNLYDALQITVLKTKIRLTATSLLPEKRSNFVNFKNILPKNIVIEIWGIFMKAVFNIATLNASEWGMPVVYIKCRPN